MKTPYSQRQALFARLIGKHLVWLFESGYEATVGDFYAATGHMENSVHGERMAADINIYLAGRWMDGIGLKGDGTGPGDWQLPHWQKIGEFWKALDPLCHFGGDFKIKDWNHFSVTPDGKRY